MAKIMQILFVALLTIALCLAAKPRARNSRLQLKRNRFLARQEVESEPDVVTPYPSADELKPEVPFEEAPITDEEAPRTPDEVYGPPEQEVPILNAEDVPIDEEVASAAEEEAAVAEQENSIAEEEEQSEADAAAAAASSRLTARRQGNRKNTAVNPAKLRKVSSSKLRKAAPAKLRKIKTARLQLQPQLVQQPIFLYASQ